MLLLTAVLTLFTASHAARILGIVPTPSFSHQVVFRPIWKTLAERGHELVVLTTDPMRDPTLPTLREIDLSDAYRHWSIGTVADASAFDQVLAMFRSVQLVEQHNMRHPDVLALLGNATERFDLVIVELLMPTMVGFSHRFGCPFVGVVSMDAPLYAHQAMGNPVTPAIYPDFMLQATPPFSFAQRAASLGFYVFMNCLSWVTSDANRAATIQHFGPQMPSLSNLLRNMSFLFINTNPLFQNVRPLGPTTIEFGGGAHLTDPKPLPVELQSFLDGATNGAIYFSLGTNVKASWVNKQLLDVFLSTFKALPLRVLWKFDADLDDLPDNVKVIKWGPQQDILRHPNVRVFVMQGGLQSSEEGIHVNVPLIVIPFFGDQEGNAQMLARKGLGVHLDRRTMTQEVFTNAITEVLTNSKYIENAATFARLAKDQPMTGIEKVVWWCEYVIRNKGSRHLRNHAVNVPFYQVMYLDLIAVLIVAYQILKFVFRQILKVFRKKTKDKIQ